MSAAKAEPTTFTLLDSNGRYITVSAESLAGILAQIQFPRGTLPVNIVGLNGAAPSAGNPFPISGTITCTNCSGSGVSQVDNTAFTPGTSVMVPIGGYYTSGADPAISTGNAARARLDVHSYLFTDCAIGCSGGATTPTDAFANPTTASLSMDFLMGWNGATWDKLRSSIANGLQVDVTRVQGTVTVSLASTTITGTVAENLTLVAGVTLGATAVTNFGTPPAAAAVPGVNASLFAGTTALAQSGGNLGIDIERVLGAAISKTNPAFFNIADGTNQLTAALSAWGTAPTGTFVMGVNADQFISGVIQSNDGTAGFAGVGGHFADNGVAAATNRIPTLPCIYQTGFLNGTAATQGRNGALSCGNDGSAWVNVQPALRPASYHASASFAGTSTTIAAHLIGNATNMVVVTRVLFSCTQTTAGILTVTVNKTSAASTGGTPVTMTAVPDDSVYAAASGSAQSFTGTGPTAGTPVGQIDALKVGCMATGTATPNDIYILNLRQKPVVLRAAAQTLEIGVGAATVGGNYTVTFEWEETPIITE